LTEPRRKKEKGRKGRWRERRGSKWDVERVKGREAGEAEYHGEVKGNLTLHSVANLRALSTVRPFIDCLH